MFDIWRKRERVLVQTSATIKIDLIFLYQVQIPAEIINCFQGFKDVYISINNIKLLVNLICDITTLVTV